MKWVIVGLVAAMSFAGTAQSEQLAPIEARSITLGVVTGVAYYTVVEDGLRVVATVASGTVGTPIRFIATLKSGQSVVLSVPQALHKIPRELEIMRTDDVVTILDRSAGAN